MDVAKIPPMAATSPTTMLEVRKERPDDRAGIHDVVRRSCGSMEANLVDKLRSNGAVLLSLLALLDGTPVGHVLYSPATIGNVSGAALGPMGVVPEHQRHAIGSRLIETGNRMLAEGGCPFIVVLGHAAYYPRFGFVPASTYGVSCVWPVPNDVFMIRVLDASAMQGVSGRATYRDEFLSDELA